MSRRWRLVATVLFVSVLVAQSRCTTAEGYGRPVEAISGVTPQVAHEAPRPKPHIQPSSQQLSPPSPRGRRALRRPTPQESTPQAASFRERISGITGGKPISTVFAGLAIAVGAFLLFAWVIKRGMPKGAKRLPGQVVEVLGRTPLAGKQTAQLVRLGNKLLLISLTPSGAETLAEVTDPDEVARIVGLCESTKEGSATVAFRQVFDDLTIERPKRLVEK